MHVLSQGISYQASTLRMHVCVHLQVFGVDVQTANPAEPLDLEPARPESALSMRINAVLAALRSPGQHYQQCFVVRQVWVCVCVCVYVIPYLHDQSEWSPRNI
eukprot:1139364-Pelagomonas_calceolata.AAC.1